MSPEIVAKIKRLEGPVAVIGACGFLGANLFRALLSVRDDVIGTTFSGNMWRLEGIPARNITHLNLLDAISLDTFLARFEPATIFDCSSFGAYSFEKDWERIHTTNYSSLVRMLETLSKRKLAAYIHSGSSSEYGLNAGGSAEASMLLPNSHYAVSKAAASLAVSYFGKTMGMPVANLRFYSIYGPYEDSSRLIPTLCEKSLQGGLPVFSGREISRDFIHVDDAVEAFVEAASQMGNPLRGESFNIGTGRKTSLESLARMACRVLEIAKEPEFDPAVGRAWDVENWYANPAKAADLLGWKARVDLEQGLVATRDWWRDFLKNRDFTRLTKKVPSVKTKNSISAVIACYKDGQAIPILYKNLVSVFADLGADYEIIFVNDCSPDDSEEVIRQISSKDPRVIGITHSRNFGSQAAFRSGMEIASKEACVLLDGDLQDPPELISDFTREWRAGADVVYGRDYFEVPRTIDFYPPIIWTFLVADGKCAPHTLVFDTIPLARHTEVVDGGGNISVQMPVLPVDQAAIEELVEASTMPYILESIPRRGVQFLAVVQKGPLAADGLQTGFEYLRIKWTAPSELPEFLKGVANISTMPIPPIQ